MSDLPERITIESWDGNRMFLGSWGEEGTNYLRADTRWTVVDSAPWDTTVLLTGSSGCGKPHDRFVINAYRKRDWHGGDWNDATGTQLSERGWEPTHWQPLMEEPHE